MTKILTSIITIILLFLGWTGGAWAISVSPDTFELEKDQTLLPSAVVIKNDSTEIRQYSLSTTSTFIRLAFDQVTLQPGQEQEILFSVNQKELGVYEENIRIRSKTASGFSEGVKIPVRVTVTRTVLPYTSIGLIVGVLLLLVSIALFSTYIQRKKSLMYQSVTELEALLGAVSHKHMKHALWRKYGLVGITIISMLLAGGLLYWSYTSSVSTIPTIQSPQEVSLPITVVIDYGSEQQSYSIPYTASHQETVFSTLQKITEDNKIGMSYEATSFGYLVTSINGVENGVDNQYWLYQVNQSYAQVSADNYTVTGGDHIIWEYSVPDAY